MTISNRILEKRREKGWSKHELGLRIGVTKSKTAAESKIKRMELGQQEPSASEVVALAKAFGCDMVWLITGEESGAGRPGGLSDHEILAAHPSEVRSYVATVLDTLRGDNDIAKQILLSAVAAIRAVLGDTRQSDILTILKDLQRRSLVPPQGEPSPDEHVGMSTGEAIRKPHKRRMAS